MSKYNISKIIELLHWSNSEAEQQRGIDCAEKVKELNVFLQPDEDKGLWNNCARVLVKHTDNELSPYVPELLEWCQDMNWPGAEIIYDRLLKMDNQEYSKALSDSISIAKNEKNFVWLAYLLNLQEKKPFWQERNQSQS